MSLGDMALGLVSIVPKLGFMALNLVPEYVDDKLTKSSPTLLIVGTATSLIALNVFAKCCQKRWGETRYEQIGRFALRFSCVRKTYKEKINKQLIHFQESVQKKWKVFGTPYTSIPSEGWTMKQLTNLVEYYVTITNDPLKNKHISGGVYLRSFIKKPEKKNEDEELETGVEGSQKEILIEQEESEKKIEGEEFEKESQDDYIEYIADDLQYFESLSDRLEEASVLTHKRSRLWNSLHSSEFGIGAFINYQAVRMVADMFGGASNEVTGFVTSGGSESLASAVLAYRNWGIKNRGHQPGEGVVIASKSVHAAILKMRPTYFYNVALLETDESGKINLEQLEKTVEKHGNKVIAIIASAPSYPTGVIDPIKEMAEIAQQNGCGLHVDCCLGGFVINNLNHNTDFLTYPGVTSLSVDTHKNGFADKGSSVLAAKTLDGVSLAYYLSYAVPDWSGGVYGTPKQNGSESCVPAFNAFATMLIVGKTGYERIARAIHQTAYDLAGVIRAYNSSLKLLAEPEVNVVAFQIDKALGLRKGATYAFAHEMAARNFSLSVLSNDKLHFCVTMRFASDAKALQQFGTAVGESLEAVKKRNEKGEEFPGEAGMYCALEAAMAPVRTEMSTRKFLENIFLGMSGARDAVHAYNLAQLDPYQTF